MLPKPLSAEYFDGWYANQAAKPTVAEIMNRHMGDLTATGLPDGSVEAVLCTDAIQFPDEPTLAYDEAVRSLEWAVLIRRVLATATSPR